MNITFKLIYNVFQIINGFGHNHLCFNLFYIVIYKIFKQLAGYPK